MSQIHPTALVDPSAQIHPEARVGPWCQIGPEVSIGQGTHLMSHVCVLSNTRIGEYNTIWPFVTIGSDPQDTKYQGEPTSVHIGDHNQIREQVTIHRGTGINSDGITRIGSHNMLMVGCHVAHDCQVGDHVMMANYFNLAGHVHVYDHVHMSGMSGCHHFVTIGRYAFIAGLTGVAKDVPPFTFVEGRPEKVRRLNVVGLQRNGFTHEQIERLKYAYKRLFRSKDKGAEPDENDSQPLNMLRSIEALEAEFSEDPHINELTGFLRNRFRGKHGRYRESLRIDSAQPNPNPS